MVEGGPHHQRIRLADVKRRFSCCCLNQGCHRACGGNNALFAWSGQVGIGGDETRAGIDEADRDGDLIETVAGRFSKDHIVRIDGGLHVANAVDGFGQPNLTNDEGFALG